MHTFKSLVSWTAGVFYLWLVTCKIDPTGPDPNETDLQAVASDKSALAITYKAGDDASSVAGNIVLPVSGEHGSSISWATSDSSRITINGAVSRPAAGSGDASVTLTATISKGTAGDTKVFSLTVKAFGNVGIGDTIKDIDGNEYTTVILGTQVWTVENLKTTKYNDGTPIANVTDSAALVGLFKAAYCYYDNEAANGEKCGALYNWYAVNTGKLAPKGWHVPTDEEWTELENYLVKNGYNYDGTTSENKIAKSMAAKTDWKASTDEGAIGNDLGKNNSSGFSALPGGFRHIEGTFCSRNFAGFWWSATELFTTYAFTRSLYFDNDNLIKFNYGKSCFFSVRLLRD